ncbi:RES domain-containing protein [Sinorhizobium meliloti]
MGEGRFNHAGAPMIYLATTLETALLEIGTLSELFQSQSWHSMVSTKSSIWWN